MPNLNSVIYTSSDYKIVISVSGITVPLSTVESFDHSASKEAEAIYACGTDEPIGIKSNKSSYKGKLTIQKGELEALLLALGYAAATQIRNATIAITAFNGISFAKIYRSCVITGDDNSVKAGDKQSLVNLPFESIGISGI